MSNFTKHALLRSLHQPQLRDAPGMVYEIWEDGEITLQKCGDLYGQRTLHMIVPGFPGIDVPLPDVHPKHSCMAVAAEDIALAREFIRDLGGVLVDSYKDCLPGKKQSSEELLAEIRRRAEIYLATS